MTDPIGSTVRWTPLGYLDAVSGMPLHPAARAVLDAAYEQGWADPTRRHHYAALARVLLDTSRESVATSLRVRSEQIRFVPAGSLASTALGSVIRGAGRVLVSAVEHSSILRSAPWHAGDVVTVPVDHCGRIELEVLAGECDGGDITAMAVQSANQEVGTRQPLDEVASIARANGIPLVVDARASIASDGMPAFGDVVLLDARHFAGPPDVGIVVVRDSMIWRPKPPIGPTGDVVELGDIAAIAATASALAAVVADRARVTAVQWELTQWMRTALDSISNVLVIGDPVNRLPHVVTCSVLYLEGEALVDELARSGLSVGSGSACVADTLMPSHVLAAMGVLTHGNVRISLPLEPVPSDVHRFLDVLPQVIASLQARTGVAEL